LRYWKNNSDLSSTPKTLSYGIKIAKIAHGLCFAYDTKLVAMATSLEELEKLDQIKKIHANIFHFLLIVKNNKKKKLTQAKYIARSASLPSGLNNNLLLTNNNFLAIRGDVSVAESTLVTFVT